MQKYAALLNICKVKYHSKLQLRSDRVIISREEAAAKLKLDFQLEDFRKLKLKVEIKELIGNLNLRKNCEKINLRNYSFQNSFKLVFLSLGD